MTESQSDDVRWLQRLDSFKRARRQLQSAVELSQQRSLSELEQQGLIQAFEFTHELAWNVMKDYLRSLGNSTVIASRDSTRAAFAAELIADGESWMDMIVSRNLSSHTYNRDTANALVQKITATYAALFAVLEQKMIDIAHGSKH
jgi:nucleotidyltransferase substrate binding protein (TIGR01987 family)